MIKVASSECFGIIAVPCRLLIAGRKVTRPLAHILCMPPASLPSLSAPHRGLDARVVSECTDWPPHPPPRPTPTAAVPPRKRARARRPRIRNPSPNKREREASVASAPSKRQHWKRRERTAAAETKPCSSCYARLALQCESLHRPLKVA